MIVNAKWNRCAVSIESMRLTVVRFAERIGWRADAVRSREPNFYGSKPVRTWLSTLIGRVAETLHRVLLVQVVPLPIEVMVRVEGVQPLGCPGDMCAL